MPIECGGKFRVRNAPRLIEARFGKLLASFGAFCFLSGWRLRKVGVMGIPE